MRREHQGVQEWPQGSGRYRIDYRDAEGRRRREMIGDFDLAVNVYRQRKTEIWEGRFQPKRPLRIPFRELGEAALANKKGRLAKLSYEMDKIRAKKLYAILGPVSVDSIKAHVIEAALQKLRESGLSGSTVNRYRSLLSSIFSYAVRTGKLRINPVRQIPRYEENDPRIRYLDADEENALRQMIVAACPEREAELDLALYTGIRRGEQFGLRWQDVDLERGVITVTGKTGRREVELNSKARAALVVLLAVSNGSRYVCPEAKGKGRDWRRWFEGCVKAANIENFTWHDLRHTFASRAVMRGVDLPTVQHWLGHKSITMTMKYAHLAPSHRARQIEKIVVTRKDTRRNRKTKEMAQTA